MAETEREPFAGFTFSPVGYSPVGFDMPRFTEEVAEELGITSERMHEEKPAVFGTENESRSRRSR